MRGCPTTIASWMPVMRVMGSGIGRQGSTSVSKRSRTSPPRMRTAPISVIFDRPGAPPVVSMSTTQNVASRSGVAAQPAGASPTRSRPRQARRSIALHDLRDQPSLQPLRAAAHPQDLRDDVADLERTAAPREQVAQPVGEGGLAFAAGLGQGQRELELEGVGRHSLPMLDRASGRPAGPATAGRRPGWPASASGWARRWP